MSLAAYNDSHTATILRESHSEDSATPHCGIPMFHASSRLFFIYLGNEGDMELGDLRSRLVNAKAANAASKKLRGLRVSLKPPQLARTLAGL